MAHTILVHKVTAPADMKKVLAIRREVFVLEQGCPPELELEHEEEAIHFLGTINGEACAACRWRKTDKGYKLERFAVLKQFRGMGAGQELVKAVLNDLPEDASYIYLHAQLSAIPLYLKFGFEKVGEQFEEAGIRHFKMVRK